MCLGSEHWPCSVLLYSGAGLVKIGWLASSEVGAAERWLLSRLVFTAPLRLLTGQMSLESYQLLSSP